MAKLGITLIQSHPDSVGGSKLPYYGKPGQEPLSEQRYPPLGLLYLSSALSREGYESQIIDSRYFQNTRELITQRIKKFKHNLIGISFTSFDLPGTLALIRYLRKFNKKITIAVGGSHITQMPETASFLGVDYGMRGALTCFLICLLIHLML